MMVALLVASVARPSGALRSAATRLFAGRSSGSAPSPAAMAQTFREHLLFADNHVLCVSKPAGVLSQGDRTGDACINEHALAWLAEERGTKFCAAVHRLDRPVSGCLLLAASGKAAKRLSRAFSEGAVEKRYLAVCRPTAGAAGFGVGDRAFLVDGLRTVDGATSARRAELRPLAALDAPPSAADLAEWAKQLDGGFKVAATGYEVLAAAEDGTALVEVALQSTGRRHQIRAALSHRGAPILGDVKYAPRRQGGASKGVSPFIALHAASLVAPHPIADKPPIAVAAPIPAAWRATYDATVVRACDAFLDGARRRRGEASGAGAP